MFCATFARENLKFVVKLSTQTISLSDEQVGEQYYRFHFEARRERLRETKCNNNNNKNEAIKDYWREKRTEIRLLQQSRKLLIVLNQFCLVCNRSSLLTRHNLLTIQNTRI